MEYDYSVPIPAKVKTRMEIMEGVGVIEIVYTFAAAAVGGILAYLLNKISGNILLAIILFAIITGGTFLMVMKDKNNQCIAGIIKNMIIHYRSQRIFKFEAPEVEYYNLYLKGLMEKGIPLK